MLLDTFILISTSIANIGLGLFVLVRNYRDKLNLVFFLITFFIVAWTVTNYLTDNTATLELNLLFARLANITAFQAVFWIMIFSSVLFSQEFNRKINYRITITLLVLGLTLPLLNQTIAGVTSNTGVAQQDLGYLYMVFIVILLFTFARSVYFLVLTSWHTNNFVEKSRLRFLMYGFTASFIFGLVANALLPSLTGNWEISRFGPIFTSFVVAFTTYTIIKHRLFDIRLVVARSLAYALLLGMLTSLYVVVVVSISTLLFGEQDISRAQNFVLIIITLVLILTFQPLRRFFEKLTNRIFYRDHYDAQEVIDHVSKSLVAQIDMKTIITKSLETICDHIKLVHGRLVVIDENKIYKIAEYGHPPLKVDTNDMNLLEQSILITDELGFVPAKHILQKYDVAACSALNTQEGVVGYLLLGSKQNGSIYNQQDVKLLEIISNELGIAIQNARSFEKIANFNINLQEQIKKATADLRSSNRKLKQLDRAKDEFISMASHQLRTPLTTIRGYLSMLLDGDVGSIKKPQREFIERAYSGSQQMVYLIADMLNVSRISTGKLVFDRQLVDLDEVIKNEIKQLKHRAEGKNVVLDYKTSKIKSPLLNLDESKTRQVIANFIDNSIDYAPETTVKIKLEQVNDKVRVTVQDHGIGVPAEQQKNLFHKFFRAGNAQRLRPDGTGLGLYMAKMVVEKQGGTIIFESSEGKGSTFGFEFEIDNSSLQTDELI
jgi:signal transduction histidine kinase